jgi:HAD superfamily hydrolase (TIGR01459 family)
MVSTAPAFIEQFAAIAPRYDVVLCDVWGVLHNGIAAFPAACEAMQRFRAGGGTVILITNAPRPGDVVLRFTDKVGVPRTCFDAVVSSGDVARAYIAERIGETVFKIGPARDGPIFDDLPIRFASLESADYVVCSGLFNDEGETPEDYRPLLRRMIERKLFMVCANPDVVVERGERLLYCAGAIADLYRSLGGEVLYAGKPYRPIYDSALNKAAALRGHAAPFDRVLAIGDSVRTDLAGAAALPVDCLFITAGIHSEEFGGREDPNLAAVERTFAAAGLMPTALMRRLAW